MLRWAPLKAGSLAGARAGPLCPRVATVGHILRPVQSARAVPVGIDLGTSNSAVAVLAGGDPVVVLDDDGEATVPSVVAFDEEGKALVGAVAQSRMLFDPLNTFCGIKRLIGRKFEDVGDRSKELSFKIQPGPDGFVTLDNPHRGCTLKPEEVSSHVIQKLVQQAQRHIGDQVNRAVVTVPAYFEAHQKSATIAAAGMAGLEQVALIQEPIAAALAYGLGDPARQETILVVDMGAGTYDVSVLESFEGMLEVVATAGDSHLGGTDVDKLVVEWMRKQALQIRSCNSSDRCETQKWHREAERAKVELSSADREEATISLGDEPRGCDVNLTRKEFNGLTELLVPRLWAPLKAVGETAHIEWSGRPACETHETATSDSVDATKSADPYAPPPRRVTQVVLAGGSSQLPVVKELMTKLTGIQTLGCPVHPKLCVATGAAIFAGMMEGSVGRIEIMDGSYAWEMHGRATGFQPSL